MNENIDFLIPKLTNGIHFNELSEDAYILSNSKDKHYLKINKKVYDLIKLVDGIKNLAEISEKFIQIYNSELSSDEIYNLLYKKLLPYGVIEGFDSEIKPYIKPNYLKLSFVLIPEKTLNFITPLFKFLFEKYLAIVLIITILIFYISIVAIFLNYYQSYNIRESFVIFMLLMFISVTFHEIGHASAAKYFGANHGGIGIGFYLFSPVYYADVTDVWKLKKVERIIVNLAGIYFELIFNVFVIILGLILNNNLIVVLGLVVAFKTFFNLNPFLRSDGYWVISDLTNRPNLFYHAKQKVLDVFYFIIRKKRFTWNLNEKILFIYGSIVYVFMGLFIYYVLFKNPHSILLFPQNLLLFLKGLFTANVEFNLSLLTNLIVPLLFIRLTYFVFIKPIYLKIKPKFKF